MILAHDRRQVTAACLEVIKVMRNHELTFTWVDLRHQLENLHRVLQAVAASPAKIKIVVDAASRGDRLAACGQFRPDQILQMFTNMLGSAHGVANSLFARRRGSPPQDQRRNGRRLRPTWGDRCPPGSAAVSYTHLTLPTKA